MTLNPAASQKEPESADTQEFMRMINDARTNGLSQASGAGFAQIQMLDADDQSNPDQAVLDNPHLNSSGQMGLAAFDLLARGAFAAKNATEILNKQKYDDFNMSGGATLENYFRKMDGEVDDNGKKKEDDKWEGYVEAQERIREDRERMEAEWDRTTHNLAGMQMTGEEIDSLAEFMNDPVVRQKLIERRAREKGITVEQAERELENAERLIELYKMKESRQPMTQAQEQELRALQSDPETKENLQAYNAIKKNGFAEPSATAENSQNATQVQSISSGASSLDARPFSSAPSAKTAFAEAVDAKEPLPARETPAVSLANNAPSPKVAVSGFDV